RHMDDTMGFGGVSNVVDESDFTDTTAQVQDWYSYANRGTPIPVTQVRTYDPTGAITGQWSSPHIYCREHYLRLPDGTVPAGVTQNFVASDQPALGAWMFSPADPGWLRPGTGPGGGQWFVYECIAQSPHGLKTGQQGGPSINGNAANIPVTNGSPGTTVNCKINGGGIVWVTGTNSFVSVEFQGAPLTTDSGASLPAAYGSINNVSGAVNVNTS